MPDKSKHKRALANGAYIAPPVQRAVRLIRHVAEGNPVLNMSETAKALKINRTTLLRLLHTLEVEGFVEVRVGSGVYVKTAGLSARAAPALPSDSGPFELISARRLIESECAALAARAAGPVAVKRIRAALAAMDRDRRRDQMPLENDRRFHLEIAEASGNSALSLAVRTLWDQRTVPLFLRLERHFDTPVLWDAAIAEHKAIVDAIEAHDAVAARSAMRRHMDHAARRFQRSWSAGTNG
jgi:DNA-binding FadR family transcriptional regulator